MTKVYFGGVAAFLTLKNTLTEINPFVVSKVFDWELNNPMVRANYQVKTALMHIKETEQVDIEQPIIE